MVARYGAVEAMRRVLRTPVERTPLRSLHKLGLLEWSIEAGVLRFPELFTAEDREIAQFRVDHPEL
jgi:hypothetical protein